MKSAISWFEIPVEDFDRAKRFYDLILDQEMFVSEMNNIKMGFFNMEDPGIGGSICKGEGYKPTEDGVLIYLNGGKDLNIPLMKVEEAGGKIIMNKTKINDDIGFMAVILDTEGNRIALHSRN